MYPELEALDRFRLDNDLSYRELAAKVRMPYRSLYGLLTSKSPRPLDRTIHKVRRFLEAQKAATASSSSSAAASSEVSR